jgi:hypothetical protein
LQIYRYPYKVGETDTVVLWLDSPTNRILPHDRSEIGTIAHHLQMNPAEYLASVECLLQNSSYGVILWEESWLVFKKGPKNLNADKLIRERIETLRLSWQVTREEYEAALLDCRKKLHGQEERQHLL